MKKIIVTILIIISLDCIAQSQVIESFHLTVSPIIDQKNPVTIEIISALSDFLESKNKSITENVYWLQSDFQKYTYPYLDLYNIEQSKFGKDFFKPTLMEVLPTENENQKVLKIAYLGHNPQTNESFIKLIYNIIANVKTEEIIFNSYLDFATRNWKREKKESINYIISPTKNINYKEIKAQNKSIQKLCDFFNTKPILIRYYSCVNPKELFEIKGFDYNPMMYIDDSGGLAEYGNIIFSGNNSEIYTHEIVHIYTNKLYPQMSKFLEEGIATYLAGSGKFDYQWHREKFKKFLIANPKHDFKNYFDPFERFYYEKETSIPYLTAALICERTIRLYGRKRLLQLLQSKEQLWDILNSVGLTVENLNEELIKEIRLPLTAAF